MLRATSRKGQGKTVRFPGIVEAAAVLGVGREHLWRVLSKKRVSKKLTARYHALKKGSR